jgi:hypothetical protein
VPIHSPLLVTSLPRTLQDIMKVIAKFMRTSAAWPTGMLLERSIANTIKKCAASRPDGSGA